MKEQKLISVVMPVYNVEKYLREALDSIVNQSYRNLQIILVDDGSTDHSGIICDEYAAVDDRITVIHQNNAGAGAAKNTGLDHIKGDYFSIIDSDDYIEPDMFKKMIGYMESYQADVVQCLFRNVFVNRKVDRQYLIKSKDVRKISRDKFLKEYLYDWKYAIFWNKLFKISLLKDIRFSIGRKIDDEFFTYKLICNADYIVNTQEVFYNYRMRRSSVMNDNADKRLIFDRIDCFVERYEYVAQHFPDLEECYYIKLADALVYYKNQLQERSKKIDYLIEKYPLRKQNLIKRIRDKVFGIHSISDDYNTDTLIYFD